MVKKTVAKLREGFNGDTKWILTLVITIIIAAIAYGKQLNAMDELSNKVKEKANISVVEEKLRTLDTKIGSLSGNIGEIKKDVGTIQTDIKSILRALPITKAKE